MAANTTQPDPPHRTGDGRDEVAPRRNSFRDSLGIRPQTIGLAAAGVLLIATVVSVAGVRKTARQAIDSEVRLNLARLATTIAAGVDAIRHARLTEPSQEGEADYLAMYRPLNAVLDGTPGVRFVYTLRPVGRNLHFVVDGTPAGDADDDGIEDHSLLLDKYENPDPAAWDAIHRREVVVTSQPYTDQWGSFMSGFAPVFMPDGSLEALVGVDVAASDYHDRLASVDRAAAWAVIPGLLLSAGAGFGAWWVARRLFRHAAEIERHRAEADRANRAKSVLLANISHELRTPLTAIIGFSEVAFAPGADPTERGEAMATVRHNADHLLTLINDLLDMSSVEAGAMSIEPVEVDARELVRTAVAPLRLRARQKSIALEVHGEEHLPERAVLDPTRTRQILLNLIGNAVKFTEDGHVRLHIESRPAVLRFRVEDTGPGLDEAQIARLFQPFSQVGGTQAKRREGTGLGLAISQHIAGLMGSQITVESTPGVGSVFTVEIPFVPAALAEPVVHAAIVPGKPLAGRRILLAEDGADNRRLLRFILAGAGAEVEERCDGRAALQAVLDQAVMDTDRPFDLVLTDWDMPVLDGAGLVAALRASGWNGPVISLTAHAMDEQERACLDAGCDAHLTKPIDWARLVSTCERLIGEREGRLETDATRTDERAA